MKLLEKLFSELKTNIDSFTRTTPYGQIISGATGSIYQPYQPCQTIYGATGYSGVSGSIGMTGSVGMTGAVGCTGSAVPDEWRNLQISQQRGLKLDEILSDDKMDDILFGTK